MTTNLNGVLRNSVNKGATPFFQPIIEPANGSHLVYEVLGRLSHNGTILIPSRFMHNLAGTQFMAQFDRVILSRTIAQLAKWIHHDKLDVSVHINAGADVLSKPSYVALLEDLLREHSIQPECLTVEVVETCQFWKSSTMLQNIAALKSLGVKIAIDDFPCWSDLQGLIRWLELNVKVVDYIKIDQSLVRHACDDLLNTGKLEELMHYIIDAHQLGLKVVAEGVESDQDMLTMQFAQADALQGYVIGKPQPASQAHHLALEKDMYEASIATACQQQEIFT